MIAIGLPVTRRAVGAVVALRRAAVPRAPRALGLRRATPGPGRAGARDRAAPRAPPPPDATAAGSEIVDDAPPERALP